jgi:hypothetical protein
VKNDNDIEDVQEEFKGGRHKNTDYELIQFKLGNPKFEAYYKAQLPFLGDEEFKNFVSIL